MSFAKADQLLRLAMLATGRQMGVSLAEIAEEFDCNHRTAQRMTRALEMLFKLKTLLKPGGVVGITDHVGLPGRDNRDLHRMEIQQAIDVAEEAGFIVETSELLRNRSDDHSRNIFDPRLHRDTDRFLLKLRKPE